MLSLAEIAGLKSCSTPTTTRIRRTFCCTDAFVFVFITGSVASGAAFGIRDPLTLVMFAMVWSSAAIERVIAWRKGVRPALKLERDNPYAALVLIAGAGPWIAMQPTQAAFPGLAIWTPVHVSAGLYAVGLVLAVAAVAEPLILRSRHAVETPTGFSWQLYREGLLRSAAILFLTGSLVIAALCVLWLALTLRASSLSVTSYRAPRSVRTCTTEVYLSARGTSSAVLGGANLP